MRKNSLFQSITKLLFASEYGVFFMFVSRKMSSEDLREFCIEYGGEYVKIPKVEELDNLKKEIEIFLVIQQKGIKSTEANKIKKKFNINDVDLSKIYEKIKAKIDGFSK